MSGHNILITGGLGYLGLWCIDACISAGYAVTVLTRRSRRYPIEQRVELLECDLTNEEACKRVLDNRQFESVLHLASMNENRPYDALLTNAWGTRNLLEYLPPPVHFLYFSTFHVYGRLQETINEKTTPAPRTDYALTHYFAEQYIVRYFLTKGIEYTILRLSNIYGVPYYSDSTKWYLVLNDLARAAYTSQVITLQSNGLARRDFLWKNDLCRVMLNLLDLRQPINAPLNLSRDHTWSILEIAKVVQTAYEEYSGIYAPIYTNSSDTSAPPLEFSISNAQLRTILPEHTFHDRFLEEALNIFHLLERVKV